MPLFQYSIVYVFNPLKCTVDKGFACLMVENEAQQGFTGNIGKFVQ